jgi:hypothetical protein
MQSLITTALNNIGTASVGRVLEFAPTHPFITRVGLKLLHTRGFLKVKSWVLIRSYGS